MAERSVGEGAGGRIGWSFLLVAAAIAFFGAGPLAAQSSGPPLAPDHWGYELVEALDVAGVAWSWAHEVRPAGREAIRRELARSARHDFGGGELVDAWLRRFQEEHPVRVGGAAEDGADRGSGGEVALGHRSEGRGGARFEVSVQGGFRDGRAFLDPGAGGYGLLGAAARVGGGVAVWARGGAGGWQRFDGGLRSGGLAADVGPFTVQVGRQRIKAAGPATTSSQVGPDVPLDALYLVSREPARLPGLDWLLGPVTWQFALAPWAGVDATDRGWIGVGGAVAEPHPALRIGATRSAAFGRAEEDAITAERLFRTVFLMQNEPTWWDDQKLELWARLRGELFGQSLAGYVVFAQEDAPLYLNSGVLAGVRAVRLTDAGLFQLGYEYRGYGPRGQWCRWCEKTRFGLTESGREQGQWYHHGPEVLPYSRAGIPMGDATGGYGAQHRVELTHFSDGADLRGRLWAFFQVREDERNLLHDRWPGKRRGLGAEAAIRVRPGLEVGAAGLWADGPAFEAERGVRVWAEWVWGGG